MADVRPNRSYPGARPSVYAAHKTGLMVNRFTHDLGASVRKYGQKVLPGMPPSMCVAFTSNSEGAGEVVQVAPFFEIAYYNNPAGLRNRGPRPVIHGGPNNAYWDYHANATTISALGRPAETEDGKWQKDIDGQVMVGLQDYRRNGISKENSLPSRLRTNHNDVWFAFLCKAGYVGGSYHFAEIAPHLGGKNGNEILGSLYAYYGQGYLTGRIKPGTPRAYSNPAYAMVRTMNAVACGQALDKALSLGGTDWYSTGLADRDYWLYEDAITRAALGMDPTKATSDPPPLKPNMSGRDSSYSVPKTSGSSSVVAIAAGAGLAAAVGYALTRKRKRS